MIDSYQHKGLRKKLVESIEQRGIKDKKVLDAVNKVPRHFFMSKDFEGFAYKDKPFPIAAGQTISQPYTVAFQTELLNVEKSDKILEIGTGSGYQAAILLELGAKVYTIERHRELFLDAQKLLSSMNYKVNCYYGDGYIGLPAFSPYDKILITAATPAIPEELKKQLKTGGILVAPVGKDDIQIMTVLTKISENEFSEKHYGHFVFVPLLNGKVNDK
jgi:protein-L-isoaspartate(D-aspartate) O-methyltransferase